MLVFSCCGSSLFQGGCRELICPRYHYPRKNQCVPLFDSLTGLDVNVKIQVTPDRGITKDIATEFERKLTEMVSDILEQSVSLQVRDVTLMYLPNENGNKKVYYVFNMFLYNDSNPAGEIKFDQAIMNTKTIYTEIKAHEVLSLPNGINIGLNVEFAHKMMVKRQKFVDLSNGRSLVIMKRLAWEQRIHRPSIEISDAHWCYRTSFLVKDLTIAGLLGFVINPSVSVYKSAFDYDEYSGAEKIYICIDLFVAMKKTEDVGLTINPVIDLDTDNDGVSDDSSDVPGIVVICLVAVVVLGVIVCKVGVVAKRQANMVPSSEQPSIRFDSDINNPLPNPIEINTGDGLPPVLKLAERNDGLEGSQSKNKKNDVNPNSNDPDASDKQSTSTGLRNVEKHVADQSSDQAMSADTTQSLTDRDSTSPIVLAQVGRTQNVSVEGNLNIDKDTMVSSNNISDNHSLTDRTVNETIDVDGMPRADDIKQQTKCC